MVSSWDGEHMAEVCEFRQVGIEERGVNVGGLEDARAHFSDQLSLVAGFRSRNDDVWGRAPRQVFRGHPSEKRTQVSEWMRWKGDR